MTKTFFALVGNEARTASITLVTAVSWFSTRLKCVCPFTIDPISGSINDVDRRRSSKASAASTPDLVHSRAEHGDRDVVGGHLSLLSWWSVAVPGLR
jgi:hypothetical protein